MNIKTASLAVMALFTGSMAFANTPLIQNPTFASYEGWTFGASVFLPATNYVGFRTAPTDFSYASRVQATGSGFTFSSWDDGTSDRIESYIFNEHKAGSPLSTDPAAKPSVAKTGDVIVFKGSARATRTGTNTSDMVVRAMIKTLGYGRWPYDVMTSHTVYHNIGSTLEPFELTITYPDDQTAEPWQVFQIGFEITTLFDGTAMDAGTIYFENIEAYIVGDEPATWQGYTLDPNGWADTGAWMGMVNAASAPWIWVTDLGNWLYIPDEGASTGGAWAFAVAP